MRSFVKIKPSQNGKITLSFTDIRISCPSGEFLMLQICLNMLFAKIKFSRKFPIYSIILDYAGKQRHTSLYYETYMYRTKRNH